MNQPESARNPSLQLKRLVDGFRRAREASLEPDLSDFVNRENLDEPTRRRLLQDLVLVDMEYRWRRESGRGGDQGQQETSFAGAEPGTALRWEDYIAKYPELGPVHELGVELIGQEYAIRRSHGDDPGHHEYAKRFPDQSTALRHVLCRIDHQQAERRTEHVTHALNDTTVFQGPSLRPPGEQAVGGGPAAESSASPHHAAFAGVHDPDAPLPFSDFHLERQLGQGGMGSVYQARQVSLDKPVAVKVLKTLNHSDSESVKRFLQEGRAVAQLRHPHIVDVHGIGRTSDGGYFMVMDLVDGEDWDRLIRSSRLSHQHVHLVATIADAIHHAHERGIVHRDLKPSNVLLGADGRVMVSDFGLAKLLADKQLDLSQRGQILGTPAYMAPEQATSRWGEVGPLTDIYGLGGLLYALLTGRAPFEGDTPVEILAQVISDSPPLRPGSARPDAPAVPEQICMRCLQKDPSKRYATAGEVAEAIRDWARTRAGGELEHPSAEPGFHAVAQQGWASAADTQRTAQLRVALLYKRNAQPDEHVLQWLERHLTAQGHTVFIDRHMSVGVEWAEEIERQIRSADAVIPLISAASVASEMLAYEVQVAHDQSQKHHGRPRILPVRLNYSEPLQGELGAVLDPLQYYLWQEPEDNAKLWAALEQALATSTASASRVPQKARPPLGAVPLDSDFYIERTVDQEFESAMRRQDSIILIRGARQMGKTSLLARGLMQARHSGIHVVLTDLQKLTEAELQSADQFFQAVGEWIADELDLDESPEDGWNPQRSASVNFERFLRRKVLKTLSGPLVWGLDEVDRLFPCPFKSEVFGLFRSWHNARALQPTGPWSKLTLAMAYATEAHLFITDANQSPFNVGTLLGMEDFTREQTAELNIRYGAPLRSESELTRFHEIVGGQPYLVNRGLYEMAARSMDMAQFEEQANRDAGVFGDHLRRLLVLLVQQPDLCDVMRGLLRGEPCSSIESFYRLRSAGMITGESVRNARPRCQMYAAYFQRHLL